MWTSSSIVGSFYSYSDAIEYLKSKAGLKRRKFDTGMYSVQLTNQAPLSWTLIIYGKFWVSV